MWEGRRKKAASLSFDRKLCKQSREKRSFYAKQHTALRNDVKKFLLGCDAV
jgi:hypothetical protein